MINLTLDWAETTPYRDECRAAIFAVRRAARLCRAVQAAIAKDTLEKKDRSPVTLADFGSQALVCQILKEHFPADPIIAEEDAAALRQPQNAELLGHLVDRIQPIDPSLDASAICHLIDQGGQKQYTDRFWTLDPIDGTKGFLRGGQYAIALALVVEGELQVGVLGCPNLNAAHRAPDRIGDGTVFAAIRGVGCYELSAEETDQATCIRVSEERQATRIRFCESVEKAHSSHDDTARLAKRLAIGADPVRLDSQTKYGVVARGDAEAYLRLPRDRAYREKIWDHAAGALIVLEAGGRVTDITGRPLAFTHGRTLAQNRGIIATNGPLHDQILETIAALGIIDKIDQTD